MKKVVKPAVVDGKENFLDIWEEGDKILSLHLRIFDVCYNVCYFVFISFSTWSLAWGDENLCQYIYPKIFPW